MTFSDLYTKNVNKIIDYEKSNIDKPVFVILGQTELYKPQKHEDYLTDKETFTLDGNENLFNNDWFTRVFLSLNSDKHFHIISYAQFSYLTFHLNSSFFKDRIVILKDNIRQLFPIRKEDFIEESENESIERRPAGIPLYQAEQLQINGSYFYSVKTPAEDFKTINVFAEKKELTDTESDNFYNIDIHSGPYALDYFINSCIQNNNLNSVATITRYPKQIIPDYLNDIITSLNYILNQFNGSLYYEYKEVVREEYEPKDKTKELLRQNWGEKANFRTLSVYTDPDEGNQITEISQALIVEKIIEEYEKTKKGEKAKDLFLTAPTGSGKSLLFQLPAFHISQNKDITIVVSPLIALMKDQVDAIINDRDFHKVAYLNSELNLIDRDTIIENCQNGNIDVLYLSPELLLSYNIKHFIGERNIGLIVIDEAHLITTWGRDFRVDYWFLGNHINKIRKYNEMNFPLVAVTATAIYGGLNDMVFDSIDSLNMDNPHIFIGQVKREDITFLVNNHDKFEKSYEKSKLIQTVNFIKEINSLNIKTLVYTPYTKHIREIIQKLNSEDLDIAVGYYGSLPADQKELSYRKFKSGEKMIMVSTKAFGMGVDISDIELIYHHAPSGLLPDYVQEVGRAARDPEVNGYASLNYATQDQRFTKVLHGMSSIKQYQIREVLKKIYRVYVKNEERRNLLLSVDDFGHIFENSIDLDQKVLTSLMMIEKDYLAKYRFNVLVARPKKLFVKVFARISDTHYSILNIKYHECYSVIPYYLKGYKYIELDLDKLWYKFFKDISFPSIKYEYYQGKLLSREGIELVPQLKMSFEIFFMVNKIYNDLKSLLSIIESVFVESDGSFFTQEEFHEKLNYSLNDNKKSEKLSKFILSTYSGRVLGPGHIESGAFLARKKYKDVYTYRIFNNKYLHNFSSLLRLLNNLFSGTDKLMVERFATNTGINTENYVRLGYFLEILELGVFEVKGGENPMVFIRLNDPDRIKRDSHDQNYNNTLLTKTLERHYISNRIFDHFFLNNFSNEDRWNFIEDYFLGADIDTLINEYPVGDKNNLNIIEHLKKKGKK